MIKGIAGKGALLGLVIALLLSGCGTLQKQEGEQGRNPVPKESIVELTEREKPLIEANNRFAFELYRHLTESGGESENVFVSPLSIATALSMANNGAGGETREAIDRTLAQHNMDEEEINRTYQTILQALQQIDDAVTLNLSNSLWAREGKEFHDAFLRTNEQYYAAAVETLDFNDQGAADEINKWVKKATNNKIHQVIQGPIPDETILYLINAIYFKGEWSKPFDPSETRMQPFHLADGRQKKHPLMRMHGSFPYLETDLFQAVKLPYGNKRLSMVVFLPKEHVGLSAFHEALTDEQWSNWMNEFSKGLGMLELPKFKAEYETSLKEALGAMGMDIAFDENRADFSRMAAIPPSIYISEVKHKSFVEVNEKGTEAAAVTVVEAGTSSAAPPSERFEMKVDRPFFFAIVEEQFGSVLFMGSIYEPME